MAKEHDKKESENLPVSATDFLDLLLKKMGYRRRIRADVRAELEGHFADELKDCAGEDKEKKARQLIAEFGDMKLLAVLLRRAKKRCRPLWRTVVARTFQAVGILLLCFILYAIWFSIGEPAIRVDYIALLNRLNQPQVRNEDNAWPHYEKAISLYIPESPLVEQIMSYRRGGKPRKDALVFKVLLNDNRQKVAEWLDQNQKFWDNFSAEQKAVILKCIAYDWVPFPKIVHQSPNGWRATRFPGMVWHLLLSIKDGTALTAPQPGGVLPGRQECPEFPIAELKNWLEHSLIPENFLEAVSVAVLREADRRYANLPDDILGPLTDVEYEYINPWMVQNEPSWREFVAGSGKAYCYRSYTQDPKDQGKSVWTIVMPHLGPLRHLMWVGVWRSRVHRYQDRVSESLDDCLAIVRAGSHWNQKATMLEQLVAQAISRAGHDEILQIVSTQSLPVAELERVRHQLAQVYPDAYPILSMEGERLALMDVIQRSFTDGGPGGGHLTPEYWPELSLSSGLDESERKYLMPLETAACMVHARRNATIDKVNEIYEQADKIAGMTPYQRHLSKIELDSFVSSRGTWDNYKYFLIDIFMPASDRASGIVYRGKLLHEATVAILAVLQWRQEKGQYPESLSELVSAGLLKELPMDPFSDKPTVYKKTGDGFTIYSVGENFTDDNGESCKDRSGQPTRWGDNGDVVFWPLPNP